MADSQEAFLQKISDLLKPLTDDHDRLAAEVRQLRDDIRKPKRYVRDASGRIVGAEPAVSTFNKVGNS